MKLSIDLRVNSPAQWVDAVMNDFNTFLQDHANCERKASAMAMSFVAKYPNRMEIIPELIETALEEMEHFRDVYAVMEKRGVLLPHEIGQDHYVKQLLDFCRSGREERFLDRLLLASVIECRGAERFKLVAQALEDEALKQFYKRLWTSEARHGNIFVKMALNYFSKDEIYVRLNELNEIEADVLISLPIKAALH
ncbi:MAG: tRNA-(ms[2]io[6]A)-hydroxylase [Bacteroidetes bacterium]|nr:tRNA-(ms[2]io[6]A)-hydroxylase [Bacteroidota bacterium]